jgi:hypothetical protein
MKQGVHEPEWETVLHREVQDSVDGKNSKVGVARGLPVQGRRGKRTKTMDEKVTDTQLGSILDLSVLSTATSRIHQ